MSENVDALKRGYEAFAQGDIETIRSLWAEDIRWEGPNSDTGIPGSGIYEGADNVLGMLGEFAQAFDQVSVAPDEFIDGGDTVVVLGHTEGTPKGGSQVKVPFAHIWRMSGGKVNRAQTLTDTKAVADATGA